ncbi:hypothetical protein OG298_16330 [Streptomyces sp. NBC_01005]|uniref:hypothetical protein n=1 Tax=unclassified Streptomyces TaxID=2593676 RepID=UPI003868F9B8|nr:hypothetical protein OG298_16330 [Streptomyces sp. NBC_01005]WTC95320.1 hypothetical protein OH736_16335 [Streptomyces sp. NBC_01650]
MRGEAAAISRNSRFAIEVIGDPASEGGVSLPSEVAGRVTVGDFSESFLMDLSFWMVADYSRSWERALRELEVSENSTSCLISSITDPETANFIFCWPIYREGEAVRVQNSIIFLDGLEEEFNPQEPWRYVKARSLVDEDGNQISEWSTTTSEVRRFRESIGGQ